MGGCESAFKTAGSALDGPGPSYNLSGQIVGPKSLRCRFSTEGRICVAKKTNQLI